MVTRAKVAQLLPSEGLSQFLQPISYDPDRGIYTLAGGEVGVAWEVEQMPCTTTPAAEMDSLSATVATLLSRMPDYACIQCVVTRTGDIEAELDSFAKAGPTTHAFIGGLRQAKVNHLRASTTQGLFPHAGGMLFRTGRHRVVLTMTIPPTQQVGSKGRSLADFLADVVAVFGRKGKAGTDGKGSNGRMEASAAHRRYFEAYDAVAKNLQYSAERTESTFSNIGLRGVRLDPRRMIAFYRSLIDPTGDHRVAEWLPHVPINQQIPTAEVIADHQAGGIRVKEVHHRITSLLEPPAQTYPGMISRFNKSLGYYSLLDHLGDGFVAISAFGMRELDSEIFLTKRKANVRNWAPASAKESLLEDTERALTWLQAEKRRFFQMAVNVCVWATTAKDADKRIETVCNKLDEMGLTSRVEGSFAPSIWAQSLPFGFAPRLQDERKRTRMVPDFVVADLLPLYGQSRGTRTAQSLYHTRDGGLFRMNFLDSDTNPHFLIAGESGSGKSFLAQGVVLDWLGNDLHQAVILDRGSSFGALAASFGPEAAFCKLTPARKTCTNPFAGTYDTASGVATTLLDFLAARREADRFDNEDASLVGWAVDHAFRAKQQTVKFTDYDGMIKSYQARKVKFWVDRVRKRFTIHALEPQRIQDIESLKQVDAGRAPEFEIWSVGVLKGKKDIDRVTGGVMGSHVYQRVADIGLAEMKWIQSRPKQFQVDSQVHADGSEYVRILYAGINELTSLGLEGYDVEPLDAYMVADVALREDMALLVSRGVRVVLPGAFVGERRDMIRRALLLDPVYATAPDNVITGLVENEVKNINGVDYYDTVQGDAILQYEVRFSDWVSSMAQCPDNQQDRSKRILSQLREYYTGGTHAGFFDGTTEYDLSKTKLTVFEVGELTEADVHLAGAVIGAVMSAIIRHCQDQYRTGRKVLIVLDEFPLLLKIPVVASAAENLYRTARKFGGVVGVIMQAVIDLTSTEVGRSILRMAPHKIIMRQTQETIVALPEAMNYTPEMCFALSLVHTRKGEYAEAFVDISNANIRERIRYIVSPYMYWLCTTDPKERSMRDNVVLEHQARGLRPDEALDHALRDLSVKFPRGLARVA